MIELYSTAAGPKASRSRRSVSAPRPLVPNHPFKGEVSPGIWEGGGAWRGGSMQQGQPTPSDLSAEPGGRLSSEGSGDVDVFFHLFTALKL